MSDSDGNGQDHPPPDGHAHTLPGGVGGSQECLLCPVCVFLQAMTQARPEVTQHLLAAARELTLALRAVVETQAEAYEQAAQERSARFERIKVD
ncbi:MAG TPA: hypothetical protein VNU01_01530 [Egibacteraceae bacterium]|nr:hypothetical protein [Egibacteraceae bacterium]